MKMKGFAKNNKGFTLIELMIAVLIIVFSFLGLFAVLVNSIGANLENELRNTAIRLSTQTAEILLALPIDSISSCGLTIDRNAPEYHDAYTFSADNICLGNEIDYQRFPNPEQSVKGFKQKYNITWDVSGLGDNSNLKQIVITVAYIYRDTVFQNKAVIYKHRAL